MNNCGERSRLSPMFIVARPGSLKSTPISPAPISPTPISATLKRTQAATAPDHKSGATRVIVWLAFIAIVIWTIAGLSWMFAPSPVAPPTWSAEVPGVLELNGLPSVTAKVLADGRGASVRVTSEQRQQTFRVVSTNISAMRIFWRGKTLVIDAGEGVVWRVDPEHDLLLRAPDSYAWPQN